MFAADTRMAGKTNDVEIIQCNVTTMAKWATRHGLFINVSKNPNPYPTLLVSDANGFDGPLPKSWQLRTSAS